MDSRHCLLLGAILLLAASCARDRAPDARQLYHEGRKHFAEGRSEEAVATLAEAIRLDPSMDEARIARAEILAVEERYVEALADYDAVLARDVQQREAIGGRALLLVTMGRIEDAVVDASALIRLEPKMADAYLLRGWIFTVQGRAAEAFRDFDEARRLGAGAWSRYHNAGVDALGHTRFEDAERNFTCAAALAPDRPEPHLGLGRARLELRKYAEAAEDFTRAIVARGGAEAYHLRGTAYLGLGRPGDALPDFGKSVELDPSKTPYRYGRGLAFAALRRTDEAMKDFDACIRAEPQHRDARIQRATLHRSAGRWTEAEEDLKVALQVLATPQTIRMLVSVYEAMEAWDKAVLYLESAVRICADEEMRRVLKEELEECRRRRRP